MSAATPYPPSSPGEPRGARRWLALAGWILLPVAVGLLGAMFQPGQWYADLQKAPWNPPAAVFGPVWTILYIAMGVAAWRVWREGGWAVQRRPLGWFLAQLAVNALWTPFFFGMQAPVLALVTILVMVVLANIATRRFFDVDSLAGWLMVAYLAWLLYATSLNLAIVVLNP